MKRRELFSVAASGLLGIAAACAPNSGRTEVLDTPEGRVLQWQRDDLLVLVSGMQPSYRPGDEVRLNVIINNQTGQYGLYKVRTKLVGRGQQVVLEAPVANVQVKPFDAGHLERSLPITPALEAGEYTLVVELPPWSLEGRQTGGGAVTTPLRLEE